MTTPHDVRALETLVAACEAEFCTPHLLATEPDDSAVGAGLDGDMKITFGMIRNARASLLSSAPADVIEGEGHRWVIPASSAPGWRSVPIEPTEAMLRAGWYHLTERPVVAIQAYRALLEAALSTPIPTGWPTREEVRNTLLHYMEAPTATVTTDVLGGTKTIVRDSLIEDCITEIFGLFRQPPSQGSGDGGSGVVGRADTDPLIVWAGCRLSQFREEVKAGEVSLTERLLDELLALSPLHAPPLSSQTQVEGQGPGMDQPSEPGDGEALARLIFPEAFDGTLVGEAAPAKRAEAREIARRIGPALSQQNRRRREALERIRGLTAGYTEVSPYLELFNQARDIARSALEGEG